MKTQRIILLFALLFTIFACHKRVIPAESKGDVKTGATINVKFPDTIMIKNNNLFAFELYRQIRSDKDNTFFSPYSISSAIAMTYAGARSESEQQISKVLHFEGDQAYFHPAYKTLLSYINSLNRTDSIDISTANSMWAQKDYPFKDEYFKLITDNYGAGLQNLDFRNDRENARKTINKWVEDKTKNKIQELLIPGILNDLTRLVLVNAIYFYGSWDKAFDAKNTKKLDFFLDDANKVQADFMYKEDKYKYAENEQYKVVEIPYEGKTLSMIIVLPVSPNNLAGLEKQLDKNSYDHWLSALTERKIKLYLPKFKTTAEFELSDALKKMGMPHPFSMDADLSGMTGKKDLMIDKVVHKAFVEVNERGTEAAAATAVVIREKSAMINMPEFRADRPFIFIIKENTYNNILFMGRINDPVK
jgi:serine protease inhibitor